VTELSSESKKKAVIGIIVDCVSEVLNIKGTDIEDSPALLRSDRIGDRSVSDRNTDYILGIAKTKEDIKILLNIKAVFSGFFLFGNEMTQSM